METFHKISAEETAKIASSVNTGAKVIQWRNKRVTVRPLLTFGETIQLVDRVMDACIDHNTGYFIPETIDYALRLNVVSMYACIDMPSELELQYTLLYATDLYDTVLSVVNQWQIEAIKKAIDVCSSALSIQNRV